MRSLIESWDLGILGLIIGLSGCNAVPSTIESDVTLADSTSAAGNIQRMRSDYGVVIYPESKCLSGALQKAMPQGITIVKTEQFREEMFPWFEPNHLLNSPEDLSRLLARPKVPARLKSLNVRYLVSFTDGTETIGGFPGMLCGATAMGMGCLGASSERYATSLETVVWDFEQRQKIADVDAKATGGRYGIAIGLPAFIWADTDRDACREAAQLIAEVMNQAPTAD